MRQVSGLDRLVRVLRVAFRTERSTVRIDHHDLRADEHVIRIRVEKFELLRKSFQLTKIIRIHPSDQLTGCSGDAVIERAHDSGVRPTDNLHPWISGGKFLE